ncbi:MAG: DUF3473 domain-containing protein [Zavarzinella sp.]
MPVEPTEQRQHILTIGLEDYFQVGAFNRIIQRGQWYRFENRLERNTRRMLELLDENQQKATFFVLGWIADRFPELVRSVADAGHEIGSKGYYHRGVQGLTPTEFHEDLMNSRQAIEKATGKRVHGFRLADGWLGEDDLWVFDVLADCGFRYDSSIAPLGRTFADQAFRRELHTIDTMHGPLVELPISTTKVGWWQLPFAGGNYLRQFPQWFIRSKMRKWQRKQTSPIVMYCHVWEIDSEQPTITASGWLTKVRHYRNLHRMEDYLRYYFQHYRFTSAANYLKLPVEDADTTEPFTWKELTDHAARKPIATRSHRPGVTIVIPCYNEELILPYLSNTLASVRQHLAPAYDLSFILVDDGSKDATWAGLQQTFANQSDVQLIKHPVNQGVAAAITTGIQAANTEIVCSMDCDCTYDPHELANMIPKLTKDVDMVTASPYHPDGMVRNVPGWRLVLSRGASWLYRRVLHHRLYTYTSCFRVYRRSAIVPLQLTRTNFLGVAEQLGLLDIHGGNIVEHPATLEVRMLGRSKMKTVRTILGHLRLLCHLTRKRWSTKKTIRQPQSVSPAKEEQAEQQQPVCVA